MTEGRDRLEVPCGTCGKPVKRGRWTAHAFVTGRDCVRRRLDFCSIECRSAHYAKHRRRR